MSALDDNPPTSAVRPMAGSQSDADDTDGEHSHRPYDDGEPYGEVCDCEIGDDHDATGEGQ